MALNPLPPEIALQIISYLPVSSLANIHSVSRAWNSFLLHHEATIYRHAACLHGIIHDDAASLDDVVLRQKYSQRVLRNVDSWKALCKTRIRIRNAWNGVAPSQTLSKAMVVGTIRESVHRIKVDEQHKLIIFTTGMDFPRVEVRDMETGRDLWFLEPSMGRMFAHLEYSNGFLIFDRSSGHREVWRLKDSGSQETPIACSETPPEFDLSARPEAFMLEDSEKALQKALRHYLEPLDAGFRPRGCFEPYAVLRCPEETRAYRFVYPTLLTAAHERVYVWDVPSARIMEVVSGIQKVRIPSPADRASHERISKPFGVGDSGIPAVPVVNEIEDDENITEVEYDVDDEEDEDEEWSDTDTEEEEAAYSAPIDIYLLGSIAYVDHCPTHIFLAGKSILKIFTRAYMTENATQSMAFNANAVSTSQLALAITSTKLRYGRWRYMINPGSRGPQPNSALIPYNVEVSTMECPPAGTLYDKFKAVHVSPCGSHLVALLNGVRLLVIPHFNQLVGQPDEVVYNHILDVQLGSPAVSRSIYLAYEEGDGGEGRVGVVTSTAVFVITLPYFPSDYSMKTPPLLRISRAKELMDPEKLNGVSCLMMSDTRLFLTFDPSWATIGIERRGRLLQDWEQKFEETLGTFQKNELECYRRIRDEFFVRDLPDRMDFHSTVYEVDMLPN